MEHFIEIGRVVHILNGEYVNKIAMIVDIIDINRVLVDGPGAGVPRQAMKISDMFPVGLKSDITRGCSSEDVERAMEDDKILQKWEETDTARKVRAEGYRLALGDFERFKARALIKERNSILGIGSALQYKTV